MKKLLITLSLIAAALCGCKSGPSPVGHAIIQSSVATAVSFGAAQDAKVIPYLRAADGVICASAALTNLSPDNVVSEIESLDPSLSGKTPAGVLIVNGVMAIYIGLWDSYGSNQVGNSAALQGYLNDLCIGIKSGLPTAATASRFRMRVQ